MAVKLYQLQTTASPYVQNGQFKFKIAYEKIEPDGSKRIIPANKCPIITIPASGVVSTSNLTAQRMIENYRAPAKFLINGSARATGLFFADVTASNPPVDLDLDTVLI
jgi:hypothetical protein